MTAVTRCGVMLLLAGGAACTRTTTHTEIAPGPTGLLLSPASSWAADPRIGLRARLRPSRPRSPRSIAARIRATDSTLVAFGTRNTLSDTLSPRAASAPRGAGCTRSSRRPAATAAAACASSTTPAIVAVAAASGQRARERRERARHPAGPRHDARRRRRRALRQCICAAAPDGVVGHRRATAPGADDDGSGTSAVVELARVVSRALAAGARRHDRLRALRRRGAGTARLHPARRTAARARERRSSPRFTNDIVGNVVAEDGSDRLDERARLRGRSRQRREPRARAVRRGRVGALYLPAFEVRPDLAARPDRPRRRPLAVRRARAGPDFASRSGSRTTSASTFRPTTSRT